jgi:hypothetical protein
MKLLASAHAFVGRSLRGVVHDVVFAETSPLATSGVT